MTESEKILLIDCQASGVAGDMILGALIDLGASVEKIVSSIKSLENPAYGYKNIKIKINPVMRGEFKATQIDVTAEDTKKRRGSELVDIVEKAAGNLELSLKAKQFASKVIRTLIGAEADLHKTSFDDTHLHEVALVDTAAEIIGCAVALEDLGLFDSKIYSTPRSLFLPRQCSGRTFRRPRTPQGGTAQHGHTPETRRRPRRRSGVQTINPS